MIIALLSSMPGPRLFDHQADSRLPGSRISHQGPGRWGVQREVGSPAVAPRLPVQDPCSGLPTPPSVT